MEKKTKCKLRLIDLENLTKNFLVLILNLLKKQDGPPKDKDIEIEIINNDETNLVKDTGFIFNFYLTSLGKKYRYRFEYTRYRVGNINR